MADHTIATDEVGVYEFPVEADVVTTVETDGTDLFNVLAHSGASPVYARTGAEVQVQDKKAVIVPQGTYATVSGKGTLISIVSASSAVVSVVRASA